jgi:polysaccharide biosynthesis transport protein
MENSQSLFKTDRYWHIFKRRWIPAVAVFLIISTWGIISTAIKADTYEAEGKLKFQKNSASSSLTNISREQGILSSVTENSNPISTEAEVIQSTPIIEKTIKVLNLKNRRGNSLKVRDFRQKLNVSVIADADILSITYRDSNPQIAKEVVNNLIPNYLESNFKANQAEVLEVKKFLEKQIPEVKQELLNTENSIKEIKTKNKILAPSEEATKLATSLSDLDNRLTEVRGELSNLSSQSDYIKKQLNMNAQQALNATNISQSPAVQQVVIKIKELELQLNQDKTRFTDNNPKIIDLQEKIRLQKQLLANQISSVVGYQQQPHNLQFSKIQEALAVELIKLESSSVGLSQQVAYLTKIEQDLQKKAANLPEIEQQLTQLERQLKVSQKTYELLKNQLSLIEVAANQNINNVRVIAYATVPDAPVSSRSVGYIAALALGLISASAIVYFLEARDRSLKTVKEAKQIFGYNWLGLIPAFERSQSQLATLAESNPLILPPLIVRDEPNSSVSESYRMLQSNLRSLSGDRQVQTIVVTSSVSGEGKSTVAANLAGAMAQVGHKVLLVDANLHSPVQQSIWNTYSDYGLSNLLAENLDSQLATEVVMKNLSVIASGTTPLSPGNLLDSYRMKDLMHYWSRIYDFVIIDSPSLDRAADAPILGRMADGILLVVKPEEINHSQANFTKETLEASGQNILGIVFNNINPKVDVNNCYYRPFKEQHNVLPQAESSSQNNEEFWDTILRLAQESPKQKLNSTSTIDLQQLGETPVEQLEETIDCLQQDLAKFTTLVKEQEDELFLKKQVVRKLQRKIALASGPERLILETELTQEQEHKQLLDETLIGQRRNLAKKSHILRQYQEILEFKRDKERDKERDKV